MSADTPGEDDLSNDNWNPVSYLDAVREDLASAFAPAPSLPPAVQGTNPIAKPLRIRETPAPTPGRTPIHGRPSILRDLRNHASSLLTQEETSHLLRSLTQRGLSILQALHDYRYLNTLQIQQVFFHGIRSAQMRLQFLSNHGLIYRWHVIDPPGLARQPSLLLLTRRRGASWPNFGATRPGLHPPRRGCPGPLLAGHPRSRDGPALRRSPSPADRRRLLPAAVRRARGEAPRANPRPGPTSAC